MKPRRVLVLALVAVMTGPPACAPTPDPGWCAHEPGVEEIQVQTDDRATVALHHHPAPGPPVLVVHGISSNHHCWDLTRDRSLAVALNRRGYDAWLLDLRGHGDAVFDANGHRQREGWDVDDYGRYDIPAAIAAIRARTHHGRVAYVGHSMGGMVAAIYVATYGDRALGSLVVVGSPVDFSDPDPVLRAGGLSMAAGHFLPSFDTPLFADLVAELGDRVPMRADELLVNRDNMAPDARALVFREVASPVSRGVMRQFSRILREGRFVSDDGRIDYLRMLDRIEVPLLAIAGRRDHIAPPDRVRPWVLRASSTDKRFIVAGRDEGFQADYGHLDLALGDHARDEIYPLITGWLDHHWKGVR